MSRYMNLRFLTTLILAILAISNSFAQQMKEHPKKIYVDTKNKIYINEKLPAYFFIGTTPDAKDAVRMTSDNPNANPLEFQNPGKHQMVHNDVQKPEKIKFDIFVDGKAPKCNIMLDNTNKLEIEGKYFAGKDVKLILQANDDLSGVESIYYSIDNAEYIIYTTPIVLSAEKEYNVKFYAVDNVGNAELSQVKTVVVDVSAPVTDLTVDGDLYNNIVSARSKIILKANDVLAGVSKTFYSFDENEEKIYLGAIPLQTLAEGEHTIKYYSVDKFNQKENFKSYSFYLDKTAPLLVQEFLGNSFISNGIEYTSGRTQLKLTAMDNKAGVKTIFYSINGSEFLKYEKPVYMPSSGGKLMIKSYAVDNVNNQSVTNDENTGANIPYLDLTGPDLNHEYIGANIKVNDSLFICSSTKIKLKAIDKEAGVNKISYKSNNATDVDYTSPFTLPIQGLNIVEYTGYDNVGNTNFNKFNVFVDNDGPQLIEVFSIGLRKTKNIGGFDYPVYPTHTLLFIAATDFLVGVDKVTYSVNGGIEKPYTNYISGFIKNKTYEVKVKATDKLGNSTQKTIKFTIEQ